MPHGVKSFAFIAKNQKISQTQIKKTNPSLFPLRQKILTTTLPKTDPLSKYTLLCLSARKPIQQRERLSHISPNYLIKYHNLPFVVYNIVKIDCKSASKWSSVVRKSLGIRKHERTSAGRLKNVS